jgi:hypothetical protein
MKTQQTAAALGAAAALVLAGCGGEEPTGAGGPAVTITVTPTVTATSTPAATSESSSATTERPVLPSDVKGRGYDFGTITRLDTVKGVEVVTLDRWTYKGIDDQKLATSGVPLKAFKGKPYTNQNAKLTYDIPLAEGARILYHHCVAAGEPLQTRSASMKELAGLGDKENLVLVKLDDKGHATAVDNLPGC